MAMARVTPARSGLKRTASGILPSQAIEALIEGGEVKISEPLLEKQLQPASLDLRLGSRPRPTQKAQPGASTCLPA
jgi:hypothetical protein